MNNEVQECRQKIIELINKIESLKILKLILSFAKSGYEEEKARN